MCDRVQPVFPLNGTLERKTKPRGLQEQNTCAPGKGGGIFRLENRALKKFRADLLTVVINDRFTREGGTSIIKKQSEHTHTEKRYADWENKIKSE